jgi:hypothetical protein
LPKLSESALGVFISGITPDGTMGG